MYALFSMIIIVVFWFRIPLDYYYYYFFIISLQDRLKGVKGNLSMYKEGIK